MATKHFRRMNGTVESDSQSQQKTGKVVNVTILGGLDFLSFWKLVYSYSCFVGLPVGLTLMCILSGPVLVFCNVRWNKCTIHHIYPIHVDTRTLH